MDHEDLVILETERAGETINPWSIGSFKENPARANRPASKAKLSSSSSTVCCNNCPSRGCKECPMYGVGLNPVYLERMEARQAKKGVKNGEGASLRAKWLEKYGYPRLVGTKGIFYADQLSSDKEPMGGFGMGKSGVMWPVPEVVEEGTYGGKAGWGGKKNKGGKSSGPSIPNPFN